MERTLLKWFCPFYFKKVKEIKIMFGLFKEIPRTPFLLQGEQVLTADDNAYVTSVDMKNGAYTIAAQPSFAKNVTVTHTATSTVDTLGIITVVGTDENDKAITEVITPLNGAVASGTKYFKTLTSITGSGWTAVAGADKIIVGYGNLSAIPVNGKSITFYAPAGTVLVRLTSPASVSGADSYIVPASTTIPLPDMTVMGSLYVYCASGTIKYTIWNT
jgi:hypothetical protein